MTRGQANGLGGERETLAAPCSFRTWAARVTTLLPLVWPATLTTLLTLFASVCFGSVAVPASGRLPWPQWALHLQPHQDLDRREQWALLLAAGALGALLGARWRVRLYGDATSYVNSLVSLSLHHVWIPLGVGLSASGFLFGPREFLSVSGVLACDFLGLLALAGLVTGVIAGYWEEHRRTALPLSDRDPWTTHPRLASEEDLYGHTVYADRLLAALSQLASPESHAIGLFGIWGAGKSSVLQKFEDRLLKRQKMGGVPWKEPYLIVRFTPWSYPDHSAMQQGLLDEIASVLAKHTFSIGPQRGFQRLSSALATTRTLKWLEAFQRPFGLTEAREDISRLLHALPYRLLVVIDEADRLSGEALEHLLRLIEPVAGFREVTFIVAMDSGCLKSLLSETYKWVQSGAPEGQNNSDNHLRRVINKFFDDAVEVAALRVSQSRPVVEGILTTIRGEGSGEERAGRGCARERDMVRQLCRLLRTPRELASLARMARATREASPDTDSVDVLAVSALRTVWAGFDGFATANARGLVYFEWLGREEVSIEELMEEAVEEYLEETDSPVTGLLERSAPESFHEILRGLFPKVGQGDVEVGSMLSFGRLHHPAFFEQFFWGAPIPTSLLQDHWKGVVDSLAEGPGNDVAARITAMLSSHGQGPFAPQILGELVGHGFTERIQGLGTLAVRDYTRSLAIVATNLSLEPSVGSVSEKAKVGLFVWRVFRAMDPVEGLKFLLELIRDLAVSDHVAAMILHYGIGVRRDEHWIEDPQHVIQIAKSYQARMRVRLRLDQEPLNVLRVSDSPHFALFRWANAEQYIDDPGSFVRLEPHEPASAVVNYLQKLFDSESAVACRFVADLTPWDPESLGRVGGVKALGLLAGLDSWRDWVIAGLESTTPLEVAVQRRARECLAFLEALSPPEPRKAEDPTNE